MPAEILYIGNIFRYIIQSSKKIVQVDNYYECTGFFMMTMRGYFFQNLQFLRYFSSVLLRSRTPDTDLKNSLKSQQKFNKKMRLQNLIMS